MKTGLSTHKITKLDPYPLRNEVQMDQRPKRKTLNYKTLKKIQGKSCKTMDLAMIALTRQQRHRRQKKKIDKLDFMKKLCASKDNVNQEKGKP